MTSNYNSYCPGYQYYDLLLLHLTVFSFDTFWLAESLAISMGGDDLVKPFLILESYRPGNHYRMWP